MRTRNPNVQTIILVGTQTRSIVLNFLLGTEHFIFVTMVGRYLRNRLLCARPDTVIKTLYFKLAGFFKSIEEETEAHKGKGSGS